LLVIRCIAVSERGRGARNPEKQTTKKATRLSGFLEYLNMHQRFILASAVAH